MEQGYNDMQLVKRRFFAMRNGVIADTLRKGGSPFGIIFGLNLPQITEIAGELVHNRDLSERLWANSTCRESMLLAPMLMDAETFAEAEAEAWARGVPCEEVADILCHRLLRHTPYAVDLAQRLAASDDYLTRYTGLRLMLNLIARYPAEAHDLGHKEYRRQDPRTLPLAVRLREYE